MGIYRDREEAARLLVEALAAYKGQRPLVLAIPRGAVPMGRLIADALGGDLDVALVRKLRAPYQTELAIGSIDESGQVYLGEHAQQMELSRDYIEQEVAAQLSVLRDRRRQYTAVRPALDLKNRVVIIVDDGIATGSTMMAAIHAARAQNPKKLIVATAVAPPRTIARIQPLVDDIVCLQTTENFFAVGEFFEDFRQVTDAEVVECLKK